MGLMTDKTKRDNFYWLQRLQNDGRDDLLTMIEDGDITVYRATLVAGYRKKRSAASRSDQISYHYSRASISEKQRFIVDNWSSVYRIVRDLAKRKLNAEKAKKTSE